MVLKSRHRCWLLFLHCTRKRVLVMSSHRIPSAPGHGQVLQPAHSHAFHQHVGKTLAMCPAGGGLPSTRKSQDSFWKNTRLETSPLLFSTATGTGRTRVAQLDGRSALAPRQSWSSLLWVQGWKVCLGGVAADGGGSLPRRWVRAFDVNSGAGIGRVLQVPWGRVSRRWGDPSVSHPSWRTESWLRAREPEAACEESGNTISNCDSKVGRWRLAPKAKGK